MQSARILLLSLVGLGNPIPALALDRYFNDFTGNLLGPDLQIRNYALEDGGSYSDLGGLQLGTTANEVFIAGLAHHTVTDRDGKAVGWVGKSLTYDADGVGGVISVECDAEVLEFTPTDGGFQLTLLIEFTSDDRVMFSFVQPIPGAYRQFEITVDEVNRLRFTPKVHDLPNSEPIHMRLEVDTRTRAIRGFVNYELWQEDTFGGSFTQTPRIGFAVTMRADGDQIEAHFDNLSITSDALFRRGDVDGDSAVNITDAINILNYLFSNTSEARCFSAADVDDSGELQITDAIRLLLVLFGTARPIPEPAPDCGIDPTPDGLSCPQGGQCEG